MIGKAYRDGLEQSKLEVLSLVDVEEGTIEPGLSAAIKTHGRCPSRNFTLPDYTGLETEIQSTEPTDAEVDSVIEGLRAERADFKVAERAAAKGDYVRFGYDGTLDGKPLAEIVGRQGHLRQGPADLGGGRRRQRRPAPGRLASSSPA